MNKKISELIQRIQELQQEIDLELERRREALHYHFEQEKIRFADEILIRHRQLKIGLLKYISQASLRNLVSAPVIYAMILPLLVVDITVSIYQAICFPLYRIKKVRRCDFMAFDRRHLAYLNAIEKFNCTYCSYANGLAAYVKEIIGQTELYWCPIKHARRILESHSSYSQFADFGDAEAFRKYTAQVSRL